ncbi:hypothetical protein IWX49DRAFT_23198 [Phyllosticta citricarpa]|uniref:Uncharacterized protein n=2 Tax=Phyllosticta TaxID=121621 RepID=A0ABR1LST8_9PEZI
MEAPRALKRNGIAASAVGLIDASTSLFSFFSTNWTSTSSTTFTRHGTGWNRVLADVQDRSHRRQLSSRTDVTYDSTGPRRSNHLVRPPPSTFTLPLSHGIPPVHCLAPAEVDSAPSGARSISRFIATVGALPIPWLERGCTHVQVPTGLPHGCLLCGTSTWDGSSFGSMGVCILFLPRGLFQLELFGGFDRGCATRRLPCGCFSSNQLLVGGFDRGCEVCASICGCFSSKRRSLDLPVRGSTTTAFLFFFSFFFVFLDYYDYYRFCWV